MRKRRTTAMQLASLALEAQQVITLRLMKLAKGGPAARREGRRMVAEKVNATSMAARIAYTANSRGAGDGGAGAVLRMLHRRVRANRKRLGGMG